MKLRNKKTGEIVDFKIHKFAKLNDEGNSVYEVFNGSIEEWEDYEEPKGYWYIRDGGNIDYNLYGKSIINRHKEIGNYFETKEEAEKAVEKLKAWKQLKDKGYRFRKWFTRVEGGIQINMEYNKYDGIDWECRDDLDLLFGGE